MTTYFIPAGCMYWAVKDGDTFVIDIMKEITTKQYVEITVGVSSRDVQYDMNDNPRTLLNSYRQTGEKETYYIFNLPSDAKFSHVLFRIEDVQVNT